MEQQPESRRHVPELDTIRGTALVLVFLYHAAQGTAPGTDALVERGYYWLARAGWTGVDLFFVLSGFLITRILLDTRDGDRYLSNFYARRILRIFPLYYLTLITALLVASASAAPSAYLRWLNAHQIWYWSYLQNWLQAHETAPGREWLAHLWSLGIEEQFYLLWPIVVKALRPRALLGLCGGLVALSPTLRIVSRLLAPENDALPYFLTSTRLEGLALGAILALLHRERHAREACRRFALPALLCTGVLVVLVQRLGGLRVIPISTLDILTFNLLFAAVVNATLLFRGRSWTGWLAIPALQRVGTISYGLYVFHLPVLLALGPLVAGLTGWPFELPLVRQGTLAVLGWLPTYALARVSWTVLEQPLLSLKRRFDARRARAEAETDASAQER